MHSARLSIRFGFFAGTALALMAVATASAAPQNSAAIRGAAAGNPTSAARCRPRRSLASAPASNAASEADVGNKIREIVTGKQFDRVVPRKPDRDAIAALYQNARNFQPLWVAQGAPSARAKDVLDYLNTIDADGLDPKDYPMPRLNVGSAEAQAEAELKFTETLLTYARHAMTGRVHFSRVSPNIDYKLAFDADDVLKKIAAVQRPPKTLDAAQSAAAGLSGAQGQACRDARCSRTRPGPTASATASVLRYTRDSRGKETVMADARVPLLRERLGLAAEPNSNYNAALAMAVGKFQKANGIQASGQLNGPTVEALNGPSRAKKTRRHSRHHGALALDAARSRQDPRRCSTSRTIICASTTTARRSGRRAPWSASRAMRRRC